MRTTLNHGGVTTSIHSRWFSSLFCSEIVVFEASQVVMIRFVRPLGLLAVLPPSHIDGETNIL